MYDTFRHLHIEIAGGTLQVYIPDETKIWLE